MANRSVVACDCPGLVRLPGDEELEGDSKSANGSGEPAKRFAPLVELVAPVECVLPSAGWSRLGAASSIAGAGRSR